MKELCGKTALITGAASGFGAAIAEALAKNGADIILIDINFEGLVSLKEELAQYNTAVRIFKADVTNYSETQEIGSRILSDCSKIDILINNAGGGKEATLGIRQMTEDSWRRQVDLNMNSAFNCTKMVLEKMVEQGHGTIINMSSVAGLRGGGLLGRGAYATAKAGIIGFTKTLAREVGPHGINVIAVAPGLHPTPLTNTNSAEVLKSIADSLPLRRSGDPKKLAELVLFLSSDDAQFITGSVISVDGGYAMH